MCVQAPVERSRSPRRAGTGVGGLPMPKSSGARSCSRRSETSAIATSLVWLRQRRDKKAHGRFDFTTRLYSTRCELFHPGDIGPLWRHSRFEATASDVESYNLPDRLVPSSTNTDFACRGIQGFSTKVASTLHQEFSAIVGERGGYLDSSIVPVIIQYVRST
jgi:hypothetical protein